MKGREHLDRSCLSQRGIATVWSLAWCFVTATVGFVAVVLAVAVAGQHHVDSSADLVALSAAASLQRGGDACHTAAQVAVANQVNLARCRIYGEDVVVTVQARIGLPFGLHPEVAGRARAGPG